MNRRQFLGRFFQAVISAHNSNSIYGVYHPWRQYTKMDSYVTIYLKMRVGDNPDYDPSVTDPYDNRYSRYTYIDIPYTGTSGPIMAVYDSNDTMIYCSAYYNGDNLYNYINSSISLGMLRPGVYTVKCLSLGKGLYLGESGQSITFEVKEADRRYDLNTGEYNKYNNYGYINYPSTVINFLFDFEGLSFDLDVQMVPVGDDIRNVDGVKHVTYTYPSLSELQAAVAEYGYNIDHYRYMDECGYYSNNGGLAPYDYTIRYGDIQQEYRYVEVYEYKGYNNKTFRGKVDVTCVDNDSITAVGFEKGFNEKGIDFNVSENMIPVGNGSDILYNADRMDGTVEDFYYYNYDEIKLHNKEPIIQASRYPATAIKTDYARSDVTIKSSGKGSKRVRVYTKKLDDDSYDSSSRVDVNVPVINFYGTSERYYLAYGDRIRYEWFDDPMNGNQAGENDTPAGNISVRVNYYVDNLRPKAEAALAIADANWGTKADYYFTKRVTNGILRTIPIDIILGTYSGDYPVLHYAGEGSSGVTVTPLYDVDGNMYDVSIGLNHSDAVAGVINTDIHKSANGSIDISGYEFCTDYSTGWVNNIVLRQEIVHLDLSDVPDHQVRPN